MIKRYKLVSIAVFALISAVCLFAGCHLSINQGFDDFIKDKNLTASVTYFLNEGEFDNNSRIVNIYYNEGTKPFEITQGAPAGATVGNAKVKERTGYIFDGWYLAKTENGVPVYTDGTAYDAKVGFEATKSIAVTDEKYTFDKALSSGDKVYLVAGWSVETKIIVKLIVDGSIVKDGVTYTTGSTIREYFIPTNGFGNVGSTVFSAEGYQFVSFYFDQKADNRIKDWPIYAEEEGEDRVIYAKFIEKIDSSDWIIVENTLGISRLFAGGVGSFSNYYFIDDVDCSSLSTQRPLANFNGNIQGNGYKVSNLKIEKTELMSGSATAAIFGKLLNNAKIENFTMENVTAKFNAKSDVGAFLIFTEIDPDATINNFTFGGALTVSFNESVTNYTEVNASRWLFGTANDSETLQKWNISIIDSSNCTIFKGNKQDAVFTYNKNN